MDVEMRPIDSIRPYENNPRDNDAAVDAVAASIRAWGFRQPIVVDEQGVIIVGHTRYKAALKLGMTEVPVHVARGLTPEQARAYRIADNQTATIATWDEGKLTRELMTLQRADYDLTMLGFDDDQLTRFLAPEPTAGQVDPDDVPEPPDEPVTRPGDLWLLGRHRLLCGDSAKPEDVDRLLDGAPVHLVNTDPPYNVGYRGKTVEALTIANDHMDPAAYRAFLTGALSAAGTRLKPGGPFYLWHADTAGLDVRLSCAEAGLRVRQCLVWVKSGMVLGRQDYHWKHEPCLYGWAEGAAHTWLSDRAQTTVLEFDKPAKNAEHPTTKPATLFAYLITNSCQPGGLVLDPFAGSGTTLVAAEQSGRRAALVELDPRYCDVVVARYEALTGQKAQRVAAP